MKFLVGTDPEFVVGRNGVPVPFLMDNPIRLDGFVTVSRDNVLLELNTIPAGNKQEFIEIQRDSIRLAKEFIKKEFDLDILQVPFAKYDCLDSRFFEAGCEPSYNIYKRGPQRPRLMGDTRFCGGHIHIGYEETKEFSLRLIRNLDYHIGLNLDEEPSDRRKVYGKAGEYRRLDSIKVEYRTPSNEWLFGKEAWMYDQITKAVNDTEANITYQFNEKLINQPTVIC